MLHEQFILITIGREFEIKIFPFDWYIGFRRTIRNCGDDDHQYYYFLCFEITLIVLSKKGKEGKKYREGLRKVAYSETLPPK